MVSDPAGLFERIPELRTLSEEDSRVANAVESGDPFRVYGALRLARWMGRLKSQRPALEALLNNRRLFARPLKGAPAMFTLNSVGVALTGKSEADSADGTYIATHAIVVLFAVPLFPLGAYLVQAVPGKGLRSAYRFFARVPLGTLSWLYSRGAALATIALVAAGALGAFAASRYHDLHLINGFDQPLTITVGGQRTEVPPKTRRTLRRVPVGTQVARAVTPDGVEVDKVELPVNAGSHLLAWNIAGAAPVFHVSVPYESSQSSRTFAPKPEPTVYCGQRVVDLAGVDDVFEKPPESVSMSSGQTLVTRSYVDVSWGKSAPPPFTCAALLTSEGKLDRALSTLEAVGRVSQWPDDVLHWSARLAFSLGPAEALRIATAVRQARPESIDANIYYQRAAEAAGQRDAMVAEYHQRAASEPESPDAQYLDRRLLYGKERARAMEALAQRFPDNGNIAAGWMGSLWRAGDYKGAVAVWSELKKRDAKNADDMIEEAAGSLTRLGRTGEALAALRESFRREGGRQLHVAEIFARVAPAHEGADSLIAELEQENKDEKKDWESRARAGLEVPDDAPPVALLLRAIRSDPQEALRLSATVQPFHVFDLDLPSWALAYGEAVRTDTQAAEKALDQRAFLTGTQSEVFRKFVRGESASVDEVDLEPSVRAAAMFLRSRNTMTSPAERQRLLDAARQTDLPASAVTAAIGSWKT